MENLDNSEKSSKISLSIDEWKKYSGGVDSFALDSEEHEKWRLEKGIEFDSGFINVEIDGVVQRMSTSRDDFGTCLE